MSDEPSAFNQLVGFGCLAVGLLILLLSGGCTLTVIAYAFSSHPDWEGLRFFLGISLFFLVVGGISVKVGLTISRRTKRRSPVDDPNDTLPKG